MSHMMEYGLAIQASRSERATFIRRTYLHLAGAILAFTLIELALFNLLPAQTLQNVVFSMFRSPWSLLILMAAFIGVGWLAQAWARSDTSPTMQYVGLGLYVLLEAIIFLPILFVAVFYVNDPTILPTAAILTLAIFGGLTTAAFTTKKDFSFLRPIISIALWISIGLIVAAIVFPASIKLGLWFSLAMVVVAAGAILYDTSQIMYHFRTDQHVAASLQLFASVALLFYYILRILIELNSNRS